MAKARITIVGAGLCGTMLAIRMAQRGYQVSLFEKLADMRSTEVAAGRSINLALSDRGFKALRMIGLEEQVRKEVIPMHGRLIHPLEGDSWLSPYSGREDEFINSVSRTGLNIALLDAAEQHHNISLHFEHHCISVNLGTGEATFAMSDGFQRTVASDMLFGADGAGSAVRNAMFDRGAALRFDYSQDFLDHGYKELSIPPTVNGDWRIEKNALHIWPRQDFMLIALPNLDGSFTVTLFLPYDADPGFNQLNTPEEIEEFFGQQFPDALVHMPELAGEFSHNPTGILGTIRCFPWQAYGNVLLFGDAAHAIVPFYGQGMNCALEDVVVFDEILDQYEGDWKAVAKAYQEKRKPDTDAIADLALENYYEMRDHVDNPDFILKRKLEVQLESRYPGYSSKYNLVTFNEDVPYSRALQQGHAQDRYLLERCREKQSIQEFDLEALYRELSALE